MIVTRRTALVLAEGTAAALAAPRLARAAAPFEQPPLPHGEDALEPAISARTVRLHHGRQHKGYFETLNARVQGTPYADMSLEEVVAGSGRAEDEAIFSQAGQAWNHVLYWEQFEGGPAEPEGAFAEAVARDFGDLAGLKAAIGAEAGRVFGSGWVWLAELGGSLAVVGLEDAGNPVPEGRRVLMGVDVWEHACYLDYENRRAEHVAAVLDDLVNRRAVGERMEG